MSVQIEELVQRVGSSNVVHQAIGMITAQMGTDVRDAADRLVAESARAALPLESVALDVVDRRLRFD